MRSSAGAVALLVGARCFIEAVTFTALLAVAHAGSQGRDPLPVIQTLLMLYGGSLLLVMLLRETGTERRSAFVLVVTLALGVAYGLSLPMHDPDGFSTLSRIILFGLLAEGYLWRVVSIARGATRWTDARNAVPLAGFAIALAVLIPGPVDRAPFAGLALLMVAVAGLALSLARSTEELALSRGTGGSMRTTSATSVIVVIGIVTIFAAIFVPYVQGAFVAFGEFIGPIAGRVFYLLVLPFAYLAGYVVEILRNFIHPGQFVRPTLFQATPEEDELMRREIEASRPFVFGGLELLIVAVAALIALVLLERMIREMRQELPEGVTLEREPVEGMGLGAALRMLRRPRRGVRRTPSDDGTPAGALRLLYWRFLDLAERRGAGWRGVAETPAEHQRRIASQDGRWRDAAGLVHAFEDLRYGDSVPDRAEIERARETLHALEAATRPS
ncbi:MAG TPA: DUF4129 domain-containing protein [Candidatus Acidoferrales bacterium]|nr:DUF4129 domain-containing protein [Candidatus Acidoferrales bacterium]